MEQFLCRSKHGNCKKSRLKVKGAIMFSWSIKTFSVAFLNKMFCIHLAFVTNLKQIASKWRPMFFAQVYMDNQTDIRSDIVKSIQKIILNTLLFPKYNFIFKFELYKYSPKILDLESNGLCPSVNQIQIF